MNNNSAMRQSPILIAPSTARMSDPSVLSIDKNNKSPQHSIIDPQRKTSHIDDKMLIDEDLLDEKEVPIGQDIANFYARQLFIKR
mgnify:CR=1 FL=1